MAKQNKEYVYVDCYQCDENGKSSPWKRKKDCVTYDQDENGVIQTKVDDDKLMTKIVKDRFTKGSQYVAFCFTFRLIKSRKFSKVRRFRCT